MSDARTNAPKIRFRGFTEDWEQRELGKHLVPYNEVTTENNQYPVFTSSRKGLFFQKDYYDGNQITSEDNTGYNIVPRGYFTYRHMSDDLIFKFNINDIADKGIVSTLYPVFSTTDDLDSKYLQYQLNEGQEFKRFAILQKQGGSRTYMYLSKLKNMIISLPKYDEQIKISTFFKQLDDTIALHQRELDLLKQTKQTYLQKMFPKSGENKPEIRFAGFTDAWEQRKLGELAESFEYGLNASAKKFDGRNKYIRITDIDDISNTFNQSGVTSPDIDFTNADNYKLKKGDILFARTGASVGKTYMYRESDGLVYYAGFLIRARIKSKINSEFIFQTTFTDSYNQFIKITSQRSGQPGINAEEYSNFKIMIPNYEEQNSIGRFFKKIDNIIALHQRKLDSLKEMKKSLLQQMFV